MLQESPEKKKKKKKKHKKIKTEESDWFMLYVCESVRMRDHQCVRHSVRISCGISQIDHEIDNSKTKSKIEQWSSG